MKCLVLGAGRQGVAAAYDLLKLGYEVKLADKSDYALSEAVEKLGLEESSLVKTSLVDENAILPLLDWADGAVLAADYSLNLQLTKWAIDRKCHAVDFGGNHDVVHQQHELHDLAAKSDVAILPDTGLTPGLAGMLVAAGIQKLGRATEARIRVGGLPQNPQPPLNYALLFSVRGLTNEYLEPSVVIEEGRVTEHPSLTGLEMVELDGRTFEAFYTSGGVSTLPESFGDQLRELDCKTLRYPGHAALVQAAFDLGFRSEKQLPFKGTTASPREMLEALFEASLMHNPPDETLMRVTVSDDQNRQVIFEMIDRYDDVTGFTSMQRATAWPGTTLLQMLFEGAISDRGVLYQERSADPFTLIEKLAGKGLSIRTD